MYTAWGLTARIKTRAKERKQQTGEILKICDLNPNTLCQMTDKKGMSSFSLAKIADELDCSVDYLLGRTDNPEINR
ncbi:MAG: XRE family transcriptional regulator [Clostridiales bacterium]|nr:XRE family transcriptional regulator [Clostridiales bacterium]